MTCTRCEGTGYLNIDQLNEELSDELNELGAELFLDKHLCLINSNENDIQVCDCCGDGSYWHGVAGEHYNSEDPRGTDGVYGYNGGLCECH